MGDISEKKNYYFYIKLFHYLSISINISINDFVCIYIIYIISHFYKNIPINYITIFGFILWIISGIMVVLLSKKK